ncbi:saccharopine dehydrogenase NADP-binding domain-containing protein [Halobaculum sp. CBA1158]|uniref:saccharopine dehydrogenase family protein n=1 Tax=Halobaculum sp. CBA1158 TaxID=2904243 RepID=UPI001F24AD16|nr:saccharopine dehydrogenase NADP-binding domain-containing protein [Halobaculum sp. CBA1158]UIP00841.1 saccharopine dehydrogenase NADP-binding domain-containing protein [Halobaculum sp. CBA1158]
MPDHDREYDIVLWGATGFTGRLVADYLADRYGASDLDWALAGRSRERLAAVRDEVAAGERGGDAGRDDGDRDAADRDDGLADLPLLVGDAFDRGSLDAIAERAAVVCTTVGPYATYGTELVAACVAHGTDYCDLSGEVHWMRQTIDEHHERARETGARIVHGCGFDSVPSDIGTLLLQTHAEETLGSPCEEVRGLVSIRGGAFSGGTIASMVELYETADEDREVRRILADPRPLDPPESRDAPADRPQRWVGYDRDLDTWTAPFVMAQINEPVVSRSNALLEHPWGHAFRYGEALATGDGVGGAVRAGALALGQGLLAGALSIGPLRRALDRYVFPDPGDGPDEETIEDSSFAVRLRGTGASDDHPGGFAVEATVRGDRDPGYGSTCRMLGESAVCLARGDVESPYDGGVLTPASGIGLPLIDRLEGTGVAFDVETVERGD